MVARTETLLKEVAGEIDPQRTWQEICEAMGDDHPDLGEILEASGRHS